MGKQGKRNRNNRSNNSNTFVGTGFSMPPTIHGISGGLSLKDSLAKCSLRVLCNAYNSAREDIPYLNGNNVSLVSTNDVGRLLLSEENSNNDSAMAKIRKTMERQMDAAFGPLAHQLPAPYRIRLMNELQGMGGVKVTFVESGSSTNTFCYTCGFTSVGGKELLVRNIHRSMASGGSMKQMLHYLYHGRHLQGHPLAYGHTIGGEAPGTPAFFVDQLDEAEATIVKATRCLEPTRLYGLHGYDVLELVPVGVNTEGGGGATRDEVMQMGQRTIQERYKAKLPFGANDAETRRIMETFKNLGGDNGDDDGDAPEFRSKKLEACAYCHKVWDTTTKKNSSGSSSNTCSKLLKCSLCKTTYYCSKECQRKDWKGGHKTVCRMTEEERLRRGMGCFADDIADLAMQDNASGNLIRSLHNKMKHASNN